ncbi:MAG TPA: ATP-binding protein, partial [Chloroflexota bacterium]
RYSYRWTMITAGVYGLVYVALVLAMGQLGGHAGAVAVRIGYIFFTGAIAGAVSRELLQQARSRVQVSDVNAELEQIVRERTAQLEAANAELEAFSYSVSHDLRAPLRTINGFSDVLVEDYGQALPAEAHDYLRRIKGGSQRMAQLIDDMLALSRLSRAELRRQHVDLSAMAEEVLAELCQQDPRRRVALVVAEGVIASADRQLLRALLQNLLANAWKFTSKHDSARIEFGVQLDGEEPVYFVRDDGAGFDMAYVDKLFGVFQRLHSLAEFDGSGVGLATVQRVVRRHGGRVWAEGEIENGATFFFTLGADRREAAADTAPEREGEALQVA